MAARNLAFALQLSSELTSNAGSVLPSERSGGRSGQGRFETNLSGPGPRPLASLAPGRRMPASGRKRRQPGRCREHPDDPSGLSPAVMRGQEAGSLLRIGKRRTDLRVPGRAAPNRPLASRSTARRPRTAPRRLPAASRNWRAADSSILLVSRRPKWLAVAGRYSRIGGPI